jgi:hypothetical protein
MTGSIGSGAGWQPLGTVTTRIDRTIKRAAMATLIAMAFLQIRAAFISDGPWRFTH